LLRFRQDPMGHGNPQRSWVPQKKTAADISNAKVEEMHDAAIQAGRRLGDGFAMLMIDSENCYRLITRIYQAGTVASAVKLTFEAEG
jgi:galactokinase/mevalonate kinase-like predicted kinase